VLLPGAARWDEDKHFPEAELRQAAALASRIYVREDMAGRPGPARCGADLRGTGAADPSTAAYLSIHNMVAWMIDRSATMGARAVPAQAGHMEHFASYCLTEPGSGSDAASLSTRASGTARITC